MLTSSAETREDIDQALRLDGNAIAGLLQQIFLGEATTNLAECASCHKHGQMGAALAYTRGPGIVLRCPYCEAILLRITQTPAGIYLDARGIAFIFFAQPA